ncbi:hypothetical protein CBL_20627 [Carabus blaptoides fortunei]
MVKVQNWNQSFITVIKKSNEPQTVRISLLFIEPFQNQYYIYSLAPNQPNNDAKARLNSLHENLRLDPLNREEKDVIKNICTEFNDIFPTDELTKTTATAHNIPTRDSQLTNTLKSIKMKSTNK